MYNDEELSYEEWAGINPFCFPEDDGEGTSLTLEMLEAAMEVIMDTDKGKLLISPHLGRN